MDRRQGGKAAGSGHLLRLSRHKVLAWSQEALALGGSLPRGLAVICLLPTEQCNSSLPGATRLPSLPRAKVGRGRRRPGVGLTEPSAGGKAERQGDM